MPPSLSQSLYSEERPCGWLRLDSPIHSKTMCTTCRGEILLKRKVGLLFLEEVGVNGGWTKATDVPPCLWRYKFMWGCHSSYFLAWPPSWNFLLHLRGRFRGSYFRIVLATWCLLTHTQYSTCECWYAKHRKDSCGWTSGKTRQTW